MRVHPSRSHGLLKGLAATAACGLLASCASGSGETQASAAPVGVFKWPVGEISGAVAPSPHAGWYVQRGPIRYQSLGMATWRRQPAHSGFTAWLARLFHHRPVGAGAPTAYAAASSGLPAPSMVEVTSLRTGRSVLVRVEDTAPMRDAIISLGPLAAAPLGAKPSEPLPVRIRYVEPVIAWRERPTLRYALAGGGRSAPAAAPAPAAATPVALAKAMRPEAPLPPASAIIKVAQSTPVLPAAAEPAPPPPRAEPAPHSDAPTEAWRIQAGAFAKEANARRAVAMLAPAGAARIEPMKRGALTLYRVVLHGPQSERAAKALRAKVAAIGFADAEVIRPL